MRSVSSARFVTQPLTERKRGLLEELLGQFAQSVNFCIKKCLERNLTSRVSLHRTAYGEWKSRFDLDCPICGQYNRPNGHAYRCKSCGFEGDKHLVASWNIAKDGARHVPADCWQMKPMVEELVAPAKLSVEPERLPVRFSTGI